MNTRKSVPEKLYMILHQHTTPPPHILTTKTDNTISEFNILFQIAKVLPNSLAVIFSRTPYPGQHTKNCTMEFES